MGAEEEAHLVSTDTERLLRGWSEVAGEPALVFRCRGTRDGSAPHLADLVSAFAAAVSFAGSRSAVGLALGVAMHCSRGGSPGEAFDLLEAAAAVPPIRVMSQEEVRQADDGRRRTEHLEAEIARLEADVSRLRALNAMAVHSDGTSQ